MYFSFQGKIFIGAVVAGALTGGMRFVGNVPTIGIDYTEDKVEHFESQSGNRASDFQLSKSVKAAVRFTLEDLNKENLKLALRGTVTDVAGGTVTAESLGTGLTAGSVVQTAKFGISAVTIVDSTGTPKTLPASQYQVNEAGSIELLDITTGGPFVQPFKASYTYSASSMVSMVSAAQQEFEIRLEGVDTANSNKPVLMRLYRVRMDVAKALELIHTDLGKLDMEGMALVDSTKTKSGSLGQLGMIQTT